ncbi:MAG TPA: YidC/Oxa1 family insertase periplasmic-domain containing protein [Gemmataceae bacterium]|nr:YidC/Oxa1 family insertase periplasmic-domain containing protein [Gemmataceae bacterium]
MPTRNLVLFAVITMLILFGYSYIENKLNPKPEPPKQLNPLEAAQTLAAVHEWVGWDTVISPILYPPPSAASIAKRAVIPRIPAKVLAPQVAASVKPDLISMGDESFYLQVRLTTQGGGVDRLILTYFPEADVYGREITQAGPDGKKIFKPLYLIPSPEDLPPEQRAELTHDAALPSFLIYHYAKPGDDRPVNTLGERVWKLDSPKPNPAGDHQEVRFSTELKEMGVKITKIFTLNRKEYHLGLAVKVERLDGSKEPVPFRYQLAGAHRLPVEGMWYTGVYRNAIFGWQTKSGNGRRNMVDAASVQFQSGSEKEVRGDDKVLQYAAVVTQFFASAVCVDDQQPERNFIEWERATAEGTEDKTGRPIKTLRDVAEYNNEGYFPTDKQFLADICPRMISQQLTVPQEGIEHKYMLYNGPVKVRLLGQMRGDQAVDENLVDRYVSTLNLQTMTDYHSPNWFGRNIADPIGWTWLTIQTTNIMHWALGNLSRVLPLWLAIFVLTVLVRGALSPFSRRQAAKAAEFQEKVKALQPELKKLEEQYKGREQEFQQVKMKYMMEHGVNPMSQMSGCLLMIAQWPIFIGLYYCLQENVFFRLQSFMPWWIPNLAAPDMLFTWTELIPYISVPAALGHTLYLGPFFNLLPIVAVALMIIQQKYMTPPATDEQQAMQQKTMKWMMVIFGFMFYKVAAGLCLYFIAGSVWSLVERKVLPKPKPKEPKPDSPGKAVKRKGKGPKSGTNGAGGFWDWFDKVRKEAEKKRRV